MWDNFPRLWEISVECKSCKTEVVFRLHLKDHADCRHGCYSLEMERSGYLETSYAGVVECCDGVVNPLILLGLLAGMEI